MRTNINILKASGFRWMLFALLLSWNTLSGQNDALHFDGDDDYITLSPISNFPPASDFTVEIWFFSTATTGNGSCNGDFRRLFSLGAAGPNRLEVGECNGILSVFRSGPGIVQSSINVRDNQWHCISAVRQGATIDIYYDGNLVPGLTGLPAAGFVATIFRVGHWPGGGQTLGQDWLGFVDEVKLWNTALTPTQLTACNACGLTGQEPGLVAYWHLDDGPNPGGNNVGITAVADATSNGNNGVLTIPPTFPLGFGLTGNTSNFVSSTAPMLNPQYYNHFIVPSDPLQTVSLAAICSGDPVHFSIINSNGMTPQAGAGTTINWYYSDDCFVTPGILIPPGPGALFSGFSFVSPPSHLGTTNPNCTNSPTGFIDRCYQAVISVTNGQNTCTYTAASGPLRICCPIQNAQINVSPMGPLCEGDMVQFTASVSSNMPAPNANNNVHINWCVIHNGGTPIPLTGPLYDDQPVITYLNFGLLTVVPGTICFQAKISNCACPPVTVQKCVTIDPKPVCGSITGKASPPNLMPDPDGNPDHYIICPGNDAAIMMVNPALFMNCNPVWQFMYPNTQPGVWHDMGSSNANQNTGILPHSKPMIPPYMWPAGETNIMYRIKCLPLNPNSSCPPCFTNELRVCLKTPPPAPVITAVPSMICKGGNSYLSVQNPDPNCNYVWYGNGLQVGFGDFLNTSNSPINGNACYWVTCNDGCFTVASNKVCVKICQPVAVICCPMPTCPCVGDPITLSGQEGPCSFGNCGPLTYFWSWTDVNGPQTATTATITSIPLTNGSIYTLTVTDANGCTDTTQTAIVPCSN